MTITAPCPEITTTVWHLGSDCPVGSPVRTRTPEPRSWTDAPCQDINALTALSPAQHLAGLAHHEAGHATVFTLKGIPVTEITYHGLDADGLGADTRIHGFRPSQVDGALTGLAAGCSAELRWLAESGLHTTERAWAAERLCHTDKGEADRLTRKYYDHPLSYGTYDRGDWEQATLRAEAILHMAWGPTVRLAEELLLRWEDGDTVMPGRLVRQVLRT